MEDGSLVGLRCLVITQIKILSVQLAHNKGTQWKAVD